MSTREEAADEQRDRGCASGLRARSDAASGGRRARLHDDLGDIRLADASGQAPPIEVRPPIVCRLSLPADVEAALPWPLRLRQAG
jgi:hypothetical protein